MAIGKKIGELLEICIAEIVYETDKNNSIRIKNTYTLYVSYPHKKNTGDCRSVINDNYLCNKK